MTKHPQTGFRYFMALPRGGSYIELWQIYARAARRLPWLNVIDRDILNQWNTDSSFFNDSDNFVVCWDFASVLPPKRERQASYFSVFFEAFDEDFQKLDVLHREHWARCVALASSFDGLFCHTPWMAESVSAAMGLPGYVLPIGWEEGFHDLTSRSWKYFYAGSFIGKRTWAVPQLSAYLRDELLHITSIYGEEFRNELSKSLGFLNVFHSDVRSFSTWRIWQALSTGCVLVSEPGDSWPLVSEDHYLKLPTLIPENVDDVGRILKETSREILIQKAEAAREGLQDYTVDKCIENFLVPASLECR